MPTTTDIERVKTKKQAEFAVRLAAAKALRDQLTPEVLRAAFNNFQNTVQDQQRIGELADKHEITTTTARAIMHQATISSQEYGDDDSIAAAQIWDRANRLCGIHKDEIRHIDFRDRADMEAIEKLLAEGTEPVMVNDRANILASTMLQAVNSANIK